MDTWRLLKRELKYFGITLVNQRKCVMYFDEQPKEMGTIKAIRMLTYSITKKKALLREVWQTISEDLYDETICDEIIEEEMLSLFVFSLKDLAKFLLLFDECRTSSYHDIINHCLTRDISTFSRRQVETVIDGKLTIDWLHRLICKLIYIRKLLSFATLGPDKVSAYDIKVAKGIQGPWAHLDLPMEERVFPYGTEVETRMQQKQRQRRYRKGLENYNNDGRVGEGHYWRELRNEPYSWYNRSFDDPYPSRHLLSR